MEKLIKVRIDKADSNKWYYKEFIGEEVYVKNIFERDTTFEFSKNKTIVKSDCTVIEEPKEEEPEPSSKAILDNSPKLIAKAGEFIKLVSTKGEHALKVNMPVKLISNYKEGGYIQLNGYSYTAEFIEKNSMKFEKCADPVSEPVQVDTPIERIGVGVEDIIKYIENDAEIAIPINDFFNEDGSHITKKQYGHILLKYLCIELREKFSITKPI